MRPTPPFDPRLPAGSMYVTGPSQVYVQPAIIPNPIIQHNYAQVPQYQPNFAIPSYPMSPQHQVIPPTINNQIRTQPLPVTTIPTQIQPPKPQTGLISQYPQPEVYNSKNEVQYQQKNLLQQQQQNYEQQQQGQEDLETKNQQIIMFWQHKFYTILERFQLIFEKVQGFRIDFQHLNEELRAVDSEEEWNQAKEHHEDYMQQLEQFTQELAGVINQNANLVQQNQNDPNDQLIWKQRYFELFEGYKAMEQELVELKETRGNDNQDVKIADLMNNYRQLEREYSQAVNELSQLKQVKERVNEPSAVDKNYREKLDYALREAEKYKDMLEHLSKQNQDMDAMISELREDKKQLEQALENNMQANVHQNYQQFKRAINERDEQINMLNRQLKDLSEKYNYLVEAHNMLQAQLEQEDPQFRMKFGELEEQLDAKNRELMELRGKVHEVEIREKNTARMSEEYQKQVKLKAVQIQDLSEEIHKLKRQITNSHYNRRNDTEKDQNLFRKEHEARIKKVQDQYEEKLDALKKKLRKKEEEGENIALLNIKIQSLEKKNKMLLQQIQNLNKELTDKEKEIIEMKRIGHSQQRIKQLQYSYNIVIEEKEQLNAALAQRNYDINSLQEQINQFESRIKQLSEKTYASSSKPLLAEIQQLNNLVQLKQNEINKSKTNLLLKENHIRDLENELQKARNIIISNEKLFEKDKDALQESIRGLERKNQQNEKKMRDLEFEFGSVMKKNLEDEIKNLRAQNQSRQENIIRLEAEQLQLRSRISHYERVRSTHSGDMEELTNRIKQLEASKFEMIRKMETSFRDVKNKEKECKQLTETAKELKDKILKLEGQIVQNERLIQEKDKIIQNLQGQLLVSNSRLVYITEEHDSLRLRRRDQTDLFFKESNELKSKLYEYEHLNGQRRQFKERFSSEITKIENEMIQRLKEQKQFLQSELAAALAQIGNVPNPQKKPNSVRKSKASQGIDYIQKRLFEFNNKIDDIIVKNRQINSREFGLNRENISLNSNRSNRESQEQIKNLKSQVQELRRYIAKLQVQGGQNIKYNPKNEVIFAEQEKTYNERIQFYQNQTNQLEGRIENLIKVNNTLKERVDSLLKGENKNSAVAFYKEQLAISEETIESLNSKIKKLLDENRNLKTNNNETTTKMCRDYEDKIFECQNRIFALERKISSLELEKAKTENERAIIQKNLSLVQTELDSIKSSTEKQVISHQKNSKQLNEQVAIYENQISELLGKVRLLESQNSRLAQAMHTSYSQQHILLNTPVKGSPTKNTFKK